MDVYSSSVPLPGERQASWRLLKMHAVDRNLAIAQFLGADVSRPDFHLPDVDDDRQFVGKLLHESGDWRIMLRLLRWPLGAEPLSSHGR